MKLYTVYKSATINDLVEAKFQKNKPNEFSEVLICTFVYLALVRDYWGNNNKLLNNLTKWSVYLPHWKRLSMYKVLPLSYVYLNYSIRFFLRACIGFNKVLNPNWHEGGHFYLLVLFGSDFVSWILIKNFQIFLEVKIDINRVNLTPFWAHLVLQKMPLGGTKDEHFSFLQSHVR